MYVDHFNLKQRSFTNGPATGFFLPNPDVDNAISRIRQTLLARDSVAVITGGPGVGKSALVAAAVEPVKDQVSVVHIDLRHTDPDLLYDMLLLALGADGSDGNEANSLNRLKKEIGEHNANGSRITAAIDITGMTVERAKRILQLVHMAGEPDGQLNILLLGPHALHKLMNAPGLIHLRQRVCYRYRVRPLAVAEVGAYVHHKFKIADGDADSILADGVCNMVFRYVGGVPRLINTLMDAVLGEASIRNLDTISPELITAVAQELGWKPLAGMQPAVDTATGSNAEKPASAAPPTTAPAPAPKPAASQPSDANQPGVPELTLEAPGDDAQPPSAASPKLGAEPGRSVIPEMDPDDTGATGMLRLEDLDARFAETIFGDEEVQASAERAQKVAM